MNINYRDIRTISRDEWDQYKCGTQNFQCYVPLPPGIPTVKLRDKSRATPLTPPSPSPAPEPTPRSSRKRRLSDTGFSTTKESKRAKTIESPSKRPDDVIDLSDDDSHTPATPSESDTEVEEIIDIWLRRPPEHGKPSSKGKGRDHPGSRPLHTYFEEPYDYDIPIPPIPTGFTRGTSKLPEMKTRMDTDPAAQVKRRRTSNTDEERITTINNSFAELSDHDRSNANQARLSPDTLELEANQKTPDRKLREEQRRRHLGNPLSTPLPIDSRTKPSEKVFWSTVDFSSMKGQQFDIEELPTSQGPPAIAEVNEDEKDGNYEMDETRGDEDEFFHSPSPLHKPQLDDGLDPVRRAAIEESKRKLAELEKDGPSMWQAAKHKRELAGAQSLETKRANQCARNEAERLEKIRLEKLRLEKNRLEKNRLKKIRLEQLAEQARQARRQAEEEAERMPWDECGARARTRARRRLEEEAEGQRKPHDTGSTRIPGWGGTGGSTSYTCGAVPGTSSTRSTNLNGWTGRKALDRYNNLAAEFDSLRVSESAPLDMSKIPWPVLHAPGYKLAQVDWSAVEAFFSQTETLLGGKKSAVWKELLKSSTRRFHPDRWRARGLIGPYGGGQEVEDRVNDVAKALNPLYKEVG